MAKENKVENEGSMMARGQEKLIRTVKDYISRDDVSPSEISAAWAIRESSVINIRRPARQ